MKNQIHQTKAYIFAVLYLLTTVSVFICSNDCRAGDKPVFERVSTDSDQVLQKALKVNASEYRNSDAAMVHRERFMRCTKQGHYKLWDETYCKVLTNRGKKELRTISRGYKRAFSRWEFKLAEIIKPNGKRIVIDIRENTRSMVDRSQMASNIYNPDARVLQLNIPELEVGDILHYQVVEERKHVVIPDEFSRAIRFNAFCPLVFSRCTITVPSELPLKHRILKNKIGETVKFTKEKRAGRVAYQWTAKNVPRAVPEPEMPPLANVAQKVLISTITDWREMSRWCWQLCKPSMEETTPAMQDKVRQLTAGLDSDEQKIRSIFNWVSHKIRYLGLVVEKKNPGFKPHPVKMTFEQRAGVCRDKAALLAAMLRIAGYEAYPTIMKIGPKIDSRVPINHFNHMITALKKPDGSFLLLDATNENTSRLLPPYLTNKSYLVATPAGETLRCSPKIPARDNMTLIRTRAEIKESGEYRAQTSISFRGLDENHYRNKLVRMSSMNRKRAVASLIREKLPAAKISSCKISPENLFDVSKPLQLKLNYSVPDSYIRHKQRVVLDLPELSGALGVTHSLLQNAGLKERKYPFYTGHACGVREKISLDLPENWQSSLQLPANISQHTSGVNWRRKYKHKSNGLEYMNTLMLKKEKYSPGEYNELFSILARVQKADNKKILARIKKERGKQDKWYARYSADSVLLMHDMKIDIKDLHTWTERHKIRRKILTYAGKKSKSELKIDFNPVWKDVELQGGRVITSNKEVHEIDKSAINVMDAGWVGGVPRYPAGKTLVVSFPSVDVGSVIEYTLLIKYKNRASFQLCESFQGFEPIGIRKVSINVPHDLPHKVEYSETGFGLKDKWWRVPEGKADLKVSTRKGIKTYKMRKERVSPLPAEDDVPPLFSFCPTLVAKSASWQDLAREFKKVVAETLGKPSQRTEKLAGSLTTIEDKGERMLAIRDFVAENIKPVGPEFNQVPLSEMTCPEDTLEDGYGNSVDRALLFLRLLELNGFDAQLVLQADLPRVPALATVLEKSSGFRWFNKVLVLVIGENGHPIYLDPGGEYAHLGTTRSNGFAGFYPREGKIGRISVSQDKLETALDVDLGVTLLSNGDAQVRFCREHFGMNHAEFRARMDSLTPAEKEQYIEERVTDFSKSAELKGKYEIDVQSYPARECFQLFIPDFASTQDGLMLVDVPLLIRDMSGVNSEHRSLPLLGPAHNRKQIDITFHLPQNTRKILSKPLNNREFRIPGAGFIRCKSIQKDKKSLHLSQKGELPPMIVLPYQYPQLLNIQNELARPENTSLVLRIDGE